MPSRRIKILAYPLADNPYQRLLYAGFPKDAISVVYLKAPSRLASALFHLPRLMAELLFYKSAGYDTLHLHWLYALTFPAPRRLQYIGRLLSGMQILIFIGWVKLLGIKVAWTVHNVLPHERQTLSDAWIARLLSRIASAKIVHAASVIDEMRQYGLDTRNVSVIAHGNYAGVYPDAITSAQARQLLGIPERETVLLFFGLLRAYKGIDELLEAFSGLKHDHLRLVIAGSCPDQDLRTRIKTYQQKLPIDFYEGHIADSEVAAYFRACDAVCLPFKAVTTSGSALLALTFGKPIVAPNLGAIRDMPPTVGALYDPSEDDALARALSEALASPTQRKKMAAASQAYADSLSWDKIARKTLEVYRRVTSGPAT